MSMTLHKTALEPATLSEAMRFAEVLAGSTMVPRDFQGKPANVLVALQWGREVGLGPLQALQNIAVINGRPSIWGDSAIALVRAHPDCASIQEGVDGEGEARHGWCEVTRRGEKPQRRTFAVSDAKRAGLWGKSGPWTQYPDRMLQMRARGFAIRDVFPDALRGLITGEEAQDLPAEPRHVENLAPSAPVAPAPEPESPALPLIGPDAKEYFIRSPAAWQKAALKAMGAMESPEALREWTNANAAAFEAVEMHHPDMVALMRAAITDRVAEMADQPEGISE